MTTSRRVSADWTHYALMSYAEIRIINIFVSNCLCDDLWYYSCVVLVLFYYHTEQQQVYSMYWQNICRVRFSICWTNRRWQRRLGTNCIKTPGWCFASQSLPAWIKWEGYLNYGEWSAVATRRREDRNWPVFAELGHLICKGGRLLFTCMTAEKTPPAAPVNTCIYRQSHKPRPPHVLLPAAVMGPTKPGCCIMRGSASLLPAEEHPVHRNATLRAGRATCEFNRNRTSHHWSNFDTALNHFLSLRICFYVRWLK